MSREAFEKMEQTGRFPDKMMEAIKKGRIMVSGRFEEGEDGESPQGQSISEIF